MSRAERGEKRSSMLHKGSERAPQSSALGPQRKCHFEGVRHWKREESGRGRETEAHVGVEVPGAWRLASGPHWPGSGAKHTQPGAGVVRLSASVKTRALPTPEPGK